MVQLSLGLRGLRLGNPGHETGIYTMSQIVNKMWDWDAVVKSSHATNCWYNQACLMNLYVKDGTVLREEQVGNYQPFHDPSVPDFNPRGCQKGACYSSRLYDPTRIKYPLKRVGPRGGGQWQRVTWDEALTDIADKIIDVLITDGNLCVLSIRGTMAADSNALSAVGLSSALALPMANSTVDDADEHPGAALTWGKIISSTSCDSWYKADLIFMWGCNPSYTQIANFHFIPEARYNGTRVIAITPDYNPTSPFADTWVPVNVGADAALALAMARVIITRHLYKADFLREQTDLPLLVRVDTRKFLTQKDVQRNGRDNVFYMFDEKSRKVVEAPYRSLALGNVVPTLEGEYEVNTLEGKVKARPVFELLKQHLESYTLDKASAVTGVSPRVIEQLALDLASARNAMSITSANWGKHYHGDLIQRAQILLWALCGQFGRPGAHYEAFPMLYPDTSFGYAQRRGADAFLAAETGDPRFAKWREEGYTDEMILFEYMTEASLGGGIANLTLMYHLHTGLLDVVAQNNSWDPYIKRPIKEYLDEALSRGWQAAVPPPGKPPRIILERGGQFVRRSRSTRHVVEGLIPKLDLLVSMDFRMCSTAVYADYVLPAAGWYERHSIVVASPNCPYIHLINKAADPPGEAKDDWEISILLAKKIQERAIARGLRSFKDHSGKERRFDNLYEQVTVNGLYLEGDEEAVTRDYYLNSSNLEKMEWEGFKEKGYAAFTAVGRFAPDMATDIVPGEPLVPFTYHIHRKQPYPTHTRRMQFYIDHEWYLELGEALPAHKDIPSMGGNYPLQITGGHARWSIHSVWKDSPMLLRLQRGEPIMFMSDQDAGDRGIADGDIVQVYNDVSSTEMQAAVARGVRPGQVVIYHDWENFMFKDKRHFKGLMPSPLNPVELAGGYGHLRPRVPQYHCTPGANDRGTRVEVKRAT